eukprot:scaffold5412_cov103-Alexandrium_tamarense.AAC.1
MEGICNNNIVISRRKRRRGAASICNNSTVSSSSSEEFIRLIEPSVSSTPLYIQNTQSKSSTLKHDQQQTVYPRGRMIYPKKHTRRRP